MTRVAEIISRWNSGEGKPYKGKLIDWSAYEADETNIGCMCAQGQVLHLLGGWSPAKLHDTAQEKADRATAKLLNISIAHSILLRNINDSVDGAPSIVLTHPEKVLGDQAKIVLAFWLHLDEVKAKDWTKVTGDAAWVAAWVASRDAARAVAWDAAWAAAGDATGVAARATAGVAVGSAGYACSEIQGAKLMRGPFFFLPVFGFASPEEIPALPADYGVTA